MRYMNVLKQILAFTKYSSWFAVHCTSMQNTNKLISGDNKGYASMLFEMEMNPEDIDGQVNIYMYARLCMQ